MNREKKLRVFSYPYVIWMAIFVIVPLLIMAYYGLTTKEGTFTLENIKSIAEPVHLKALWTAIRLSVICTAVCFLLALPLALVIRGLHIRSNGFIIFIFILPMWMNFLLRTIAWQSLLERTGVINAVLSFFGLPEQNMINTEGAIVLGMVYNYLPFMILPLYTVMEKIDTSVLEAAQDLGCNGINTLLRVTVPLSLPGIMSGITMVFVPAISTFIISRMLGGGGNLLIGDLIEMQFLGNAYNPNLGASIALVLMVIILLIMTIMNQFDDDEDRVLM